MAKILITGGAGFIGSNFVHYWLKNHPEDQITVLDKLTYAGHRQNLQSALKRAQIKFVEGDICDFPLVKKLVKKVDGIIHFAAETHVDRSLAGLSSIRLFNQTNIEGTVSLLQAALEAGGKRFHHISTDEVFGDLPYDQPQLKFHESFPYNPHSPYAISKAAGDYYARFYHHTYGLPVTISNCTNNYGPYQTPEKMVPRSILLLQKGEKIKLYADAEGKPGLNVRDWLHVEDHCRAIDLIYHHGRSGETYCVGGNAEVTNRRLIEVILKIMTEITGKKLNFINNVELVKDRPGHDRRYAMDTTKIESKLGWKRLYSFETGLEQTIYWYNAPRGRRWLKKLMETAKEVRKGQDHLPPSTNFL